MSSRVYSPSPTGALFHADNSLVRCLLGNFGSGKSVTCVIELLRRGMEQAPDPRGVRNTRWAVIRSTYAELKTTTIETFMAWMEPYGKITYDSPIRWQSDTTRRMPDGTVLDMEVLFFPLDSPKDVRRLLSLELTGAWMNEARELPGNVISPLIGRLRGWPRREMDETGKVIFAGATWTGIIMDSNPPGERSWMYEKFEVERPRNWKMFKQPGALIALPDGTYIPNPKAENIKNLEGGYEYYFRQLAGAKQDYIDVHILGKYGTSYAGKPVFRAYDEKIHLSATDLLPDSRTPIVVGMDFGLTPAALFTQMDRHGRVLILGELTPEDVLFEEFIDEHFIPYVNANFANHPIQVVGDPAGISRSALSQRTAFQMLKERGIAARPAPANDLGSRIDAVTHYLTRNNGFLVAPRCQTFREGMRGGYHYEMAQGSREVYKEIPVKNFVSHICDAGQYACLHYYRDALRNQRRPRFDPMAPATPASNFRFV